MGKVQINNEVSFTGEALTKIQKYFMTQGKETISIKDMGDGETIDPVGYVEFIDIKDDGTENEVFSIIDATNTVYATVSKTFANSFKSISDIMDGEKFTVKKISGTTKNGREYVDCELVI